MRKSRFSEEQIIKILKDAGLSAGDLCRKYGISDAASGTQITAPVSILMSSEHL
jgi:hypothetical protein